MKNDKNKRIAFVVYSRLYEHLNRVLMKDHYERIRIINSSFNDTIQNIGPLINDDLIDVIIAGGSNARVIKENFPQFPMVTLRVSGFDLLSAFVEAMKVSSKVAIVTYKSEAPWTSKIMAYEESLKIDIHSIQYRDISELNGIMQDLKNKNITAVVGASVVCDYAESNGLYPILVYSSQSVRDSVGDAFNLQDSIRNEKEINTYLRTIIEFTQSGIIAIDQDKNITTCNTQAANILGIDLKSALNKDIKTVLPSSELDKVMLTGETETNVLMKINDNLTINTNRIPIIIDGITIGAVATFHDVVEIQKVEQKIRKNMHYDKKGLSTKYSFEDIVGQSEVIRETINMAKIYAKSDQTILIHGETGTGKELLAHSIHNESKRSNKPFVAINCAALPANLLESELFGYEGGSFTGAKKEGKQGLFELAHEGTIFLDEISEMPQSLQTRLLRVLQEKELLRIGGSKVIPVDVRVIATTNENLREKVNNNEFREDLYYRLNVLYLEVPPLRERPDDIPLLVDKFLEDSISVPTKNRKKWEEISSCLVKYDWPGNIRQLENTVQRLMVIFNADINKAPMDILEKAMGLDFSTKPGDRINRSERAKLLNVLEEVQWNRQKAAEVLDISRTTLWRKMKKYNLTDAI